MLNISVAHAEFPGSDLMAWMEFAMGAAACSEIRFTGSPRAPTGILDRRSCPGRPRVIQGKSNAVSGLFIAERRMTTEDAAIKGECD